MTSVWIVRGLIPYEGKDNLSAWWTEDKAKADVVKREEHDRTCSGEVFDDECRTTHYGQGNYFVEELKVS